MFGNRIDELDANNNCCDAHDDDMDDDNCDESRRRCSKRRESLDRDRSRPDEGIVRQTEKKLQPTYAIWETATLSVSLEDSLIRSYFFVLEIKQIFFKSLRKVSEKEREHLSLKICFCSVMNYFCRQTLKSSNLKVKLDNGRTFASSFYVSLK